MAENEKVRYKGRDWLGLLSIGFFLVLVGTIWAITPNLTEKVGAFLTDFDLKNVTENIVFPAPEHEHRHLVVYTAAMQFCFIFGVFNIVVLALRLALRDSLDKIGETISSIVFWLSAGFFLNLLTKQTLGWFSFLAGLLVSVGLTIMASSIVKLFKKA